MMFMFYKKLVTITFTSRDSDSCYRETNFQAFSYLSLFIHYFVIKYDEAFKHSQHIVLTDDGD